MSPLQLTIIRTLRLPFAFVVLINVLYLMQFEGLWNLNSVCGIRPREWEGILGIITSPLMHGSWEHVFNNSLPLLVLGAAIFYFYPTLALRTIPWIWLASGVMVWFTARSGTNHIGASGLVYGLVTFLFFSGVLRRYGRLIAISMLVVFMYGSLVWGILPIKEEVSWEGHLWGALVGMGMAYYYRPEGPQRPRYGWEDEEDDENEDGPWNPNYVAKDIFHPKARPIRIQYIYKPSKPDERPSDRTPSPPEQPNAEQDQKDTEDGIDP
jgi:membrane associated rhomboid family serine protease